MGGRAARADPFSAPGARGMARRLVLASANQGKLRELRALLEPLGWQLSSQAQFGVSSIAETGLTFVDNALLKARHASAHTALPALADDSGLEVDALGGRPGIHSARYAGEGADDESNNRKLLEELAGISGAVRTARYRCVIVVVRAADDPDPIVCEGSWEGTIATTPAG